MSLMPTLVVLVLKMSKTINNWLSLTLSFYFINFYVIPCDVSMKRIRNVQIVETYILN